MPRVEKTSHDVRLKPSAPFDMNVLSQGGPEIEVVDGDKDFRKLAEDAAFMEEPVVIRFHSSNNTNDPKLIEVAVGTSSPDGKTGKKTTRFGFMRGKPYVVPRFVVEVLAHAKVSTLRQIPDPQNPHNPEMLNVTEHSFFYPFEVLKDENPKGEMWREKVMADPC